MDAQLPPQDNLPPWEKVDITQIPYVDPASAFRTAVERETLPSLTERNPNNSTSAPVPRNANGMNRRLSRRTASASSTHTSENRVKTPLTAPLFASKAEMIPAAPRTSPELPSFVYRPSQEPAPSSANQNTSNPPKLPPTPPYSERGSFGTPSSYDTPKSISSPDSAPSTWESKCAIPPKDTKAACTCGHRKRPSKLARWKSALKDLFHQESVDDSELERIETPHWTDQ